jgi:hypothetical protein
MHGDPISYTHCKILRQRPREMSAGFWRSASCSASRSKVSIFDTKTSLLCGCDCSCASELVSASLMSICCETASLLEMPYCSRTESRWTGATSSSKKRRRSSREDGAFCSGCPCKQASAIQTDRSVLSTCGLISWGCRKLVDAKTASGVFLLL